MPCGTVPSLVTVGGRSVPCGTVPQSLVTVGGYSVPCSCVELTEKDWRKVENMPKNSSVDISVGSSPKNDSVCINCSTKRK